MNAFNWKMKIFLPGRFFLVFFSSVTILTVLLSPSSAGEQRTEKPILHARRWIAITGKPLGATAGAMIFQKGGNAVDASCAMLAAVCTMYDVLSWGGETQAIIYNPHKGIVYGINALGVAPTGATKEFFQEKGMAYPPEYGPLAAVTPGTPGGLLVMLAEFGTMSLQDILEPAIQMAEGYPIEKETADSIERHKERIKEWPYSRAVFLPHLKEKREAQQSVEARMIAQPGGEGPAARHGKGEITTQVGKGKITTSRRDGEMTIQAGEIETLLENSKGERTPPSVKRGASPGETREAPYPGEIFRQPDLLATLRKLVEAEQEALAVGKSRKEAIYAAYDRFYKGDIAREFVRGCQEQGGLITLDDLADWKVYIEEPVKTDYKGIEVFKLTTWVQGPVLLQAFNILENLDLKAMGYNSAKYIHTLYQAMNLSFADRDFYYGDPYFPPEEPIEGLLSKAYARKRFQQIDWKRNDPDVKPGDPYPFEGKKNPYLGHLENRLKAFPEGRAEPSASSAHSETSPDDDFFKGTTSIQAADEEGWVVSVTPSGGWIPAMIAGKTGIGMSQRMQSFVLDEARNPFNVVEPGKRPRATLTPSLALKDGKPFLSFAVQGGDSQDQNLLQFFLNVVEFGMNVQEATEAANITSFQMHSSFGDHRSEPGRLLLNESIPANVRKKLERMGYKLEFQKRTSGPINAIFFDREHGTLWGGSSDYGEDYGIAW